MRSKIRPSGSPTPLFSFVVVADTHVNESDNVSSSPFETNHLANERSRFVFQDIAAMNPAPEFVVHLGDIVHPMPALPTFMQAVEQFKALEQRFPEDPLLKFHLNRIEKGLLTTLIKMEDK
jgi:metallophosphoesterase superfamily enzyme